MFVVWAFLIFVVLAAVAVYKSDFQFERSNDEEYLADLKRKVEKCQHKN